MHRTYVYVDGLNLYHRALRHTPYKWLNLRKLFQSVLSEQNDIQVIRYYTADVSGKIDPGAPLRQRVYLRALGTIPGLTIHKGSFLVTPKKRQLVNPPHNIVWVFNPEEKGSDVNLACHIVADGYKKLYDVAVIVSNDTDLVEPMRIVAEDLKRPVGLICTTEQAAHSLKQQATFIKHLTPARLRDAQFPFVIPSTNIRRPAEW